MPSWYNCEPFIYRQKKETIRASGQKMCPSKIASKCNSCALLVQHSKESLKVFKMVFCHPFGHFAPAVQASTEPCTKPPSFGPQSGYLLSPADLKPLDI